MLKQTDVKYRIVNDCMEKNSSLNNLLIYFELLIPTDRTNPVSYQI